MNSNYFNDADVTWQKYHKQWKKQQEKMRLKVKIQDKFNWKIPSNVKIKYNPTNNIGQVHINQNVSTNRYKKRQNNVNISNNNNNNNNNDDFKAETLRYIGGVDISPTKPGQFEYDAACAGLMIFEYPSMKLIHSETEIVTLKHPYIAGFLAFREVSYLIKLVNRVKKKKPSIVPQVILVDGNGILHYRRTGLATHLSMRVNIPCVGIAKKLLAVDKINPDNLVPQLSARLNKLYSFSKIYGFNNEAIGVAIRTNLNADIVYISPGHMISFDSSIKIVILCMDKSHRYKLPIPTEKADFVTRKEIRKYEKENINMYSYNNNNYNNYNNNNQFKDNVRTYQSFKNSNNSLNLNVDKNRRTRRTKGGNNNNNNTNDDNKNNNLQYQSKGTVNNNNNNNNNTVNKKKRRWRKRNNNANNTNKQQDNVNKSSVKTSKKKTKPKKQWRKINISDI